MVSVPVELSKRILRESVAAIRGFRQPLDGLLRVFMTAVRVQIDSAEHVLCVDITKPGGFFKVTERCIHILFRPGSGVKHLAETVLELIVAALFLHLLKSLKGDFEMPRGFRAVD